VIRYVLRTAPVVARALLSRRPSHISRIERTVALAEIDTNRHMNQAVYAQVLELGRADLIIRSGALTRWRRAGIRPVVASQHIVYRRELKRGTRYAVETRCVAMRGRLLVMQNHVLVGDRVHAKADVEVIFIGGDGGVLGPDAAASACDGLLVDPLEVRDWQVVDSASAQAG